jgi:glycosyltransferase involved in cell wall biosynthesis
LNKKLIVVGHGPCLESLQKRAGNTVLFKKFVSDDARNNYYAHCKALLFCNEEDLGLTPLECHAWGKPVIAYGRGGVLETVVDGVTGLFFSEQTVDSLIESLLLFESCQFSCDACRKQAAQFSYTSFRSKLTAIIDEELTHVVV